MYNHDLARYIGEEVNTCMQQSGNTNKKPVVIGFAKLSDVIHNDTIRKQSHSIKDVEEKARCFITFLYFINHADYVGRTFEAVCLFVCLFGCLFLRSITHKRMILKCSNFIPLSREND